MWRNIGVSPLPIATQAGPAAALSSSRKRQEPFVTRTDPGHSDLRATAPATLLPAAAPATMQRLARSPLRFLRHYVRSHPIGHTIVLISVVAAVMCSVSTQYGMKRLIDAIAAGNTTSHAPAA